jgi:hypothetical protein
LFWLVNFGNIFQSERSLHILSEMIWFIDRPIVLARYFLGVHVPFYYHFWGYIQIFGDAMYPLTFHLEVQRKSHARSCTIKNWGVMVFNATFNNISAISWLSCFIGGVSRENHRPAASLTNLINNVSSNKGGRILLHLHNI